VHSRDRKLSIGASLAVLGAIGMSLAPAMGATELPAPWSFLAGLLVGLSASAGAGLTLTGLVERRYKPAKLLRS
jgi:hypothetical protein